MDASDEGIHLQPVILELCPLGHQHRPGALYPLLQSLHTHFTQCCTIDDLNESMGLAHEAISLLSEGHPQRSNCLNELAVSLTYRFSHQGTFHDLDEAISVYEQVLLLRPVRHESHCFSLSNLSTEPSCGDRIRAPNLVIAPSWGAYAFSMNGKAPCTLYFP
ncbi:uncharacterized protein EDB91DRAFT_1063090 [Suillus paluster]|uniref:uncharacterized protein n=1 Tax=Suillus paluster TaxID=48578 RepID=UPI001B86C37B|nr:uncharacterized protein EDB91DRAFT_1063090 [Suillus paluster]KAG1723914.1 hypothetical protein EDB91DRAFT_1063090 [Suillus paluster]